MSKSPQRGKSVKKFKPYGLVISRHGAVIEEARQAGMGVLEITTEACRLVTANGDETTGPGEPAGGFGLRHLGAARYDGWYDLATWLKDTTTGLLATGKKSISRPLILIDPDHPWREFLLFVSRVHGLAFGLLHVEPLGPVRVVEYALLTNAAVQVFIADELAEAFHKAVILPYRSASSLKEVTRMHFPIGDNDWLEERKTPPAKVKRKKKATAEVSDKDRPIRVLLMAYFTGDCRSVGVARPNYWFDQLGALSGGRVEVDIVTATEWQDRREGVHWVRDHYIASLLDDDGTMPDWGRQTIANEQKDARAFSTLSHYWRLAVERYFDQLDCNYDVVIISGNPFSCFDFAAYAKARWYARVVLDYRDPFANNPRILYADDQRAHARYVEKGYNLQADLLVTVNQECLEYFECKTEIPSYVIENGFDERVLKHVDRQNLGPKQIKLVHAGSFYHDRSPDALIEALDPATHRFHHIGGHGGIADHLMDKPQLKLHGRQPYPATLGILSGGDIGVLFISKTAFETTTKIYDYLAMGLEILICTHGEIGKGALAQMLEGVPDIHWCNNTPTSIAEFLASYQPDRNRKSAKNTERFSRSFQTRELIAQLTKLAD